MEIVLDGVSVVRDGVRVLDGVNAEFVEHTYTAVLGAQTESGRAILACIAGLAVPDEGRVLIDGTDIGLLDDDARARLRRTAVSYIASSTPLVPSLTAAENIALPATIDGRSLEHVDELVAAFGLAAILPRVPEELNPAEQARVSLARALASGATTILIDEPTANLAKKHRLEVLELIRMAWREFGATVVTTTANLFETAFADRALVVMDGKISARISHPTSHAVLAALEELE